MKTVVMAGGRGTRIAQVNSEVPKPMIPVLGKPILLYETEGLKSQGCTEFIFVIGYKGDVIKNYFGDGRAFGIEIEYFEETEPLGTAGALYYLQKKLTEDFLLVNGDIIFDIDVQRFYDFHRKSGAVATLLTHPNSHPYDSGIIIADENNRVVSWLAKEDERQWYKNRVNSGIHLLSPEIFEMSGGNGLFNGGKLDLDRQVLRPLIQSGRVFAYDSPEYVKDMGTPDRLSSVTDDIKSGRVKNKRLSEKQKAIFLDRDGTINKYVGFLNDISQMELLPCSCEAISRINGSEYLAIVVTNQPVVARGETTLAQLGEIHNKMETLLGEKGAYVDDIFFCPHHPDKGFENEVAELKFDCECRKPKPGMLLSAAKKYNIDLSASYSVGDSKNDIDAGKAAGVKTVIIGDNDCGADFEAKDLRDAVNKIIDGRK